MTSIHTPTDDKWGKLYAALGVELGDRNGNERTASACPFCGTAAKFSVNVTNGQFQCFSRNKCGKTGNATTFLRWWYEQHLDATTDDHRRPLKAKRGLSLQTQKKFGLAWDDTREEWLLPARNEQGEVVNIQRYDPATGDKRTLPGLPLPLYGLGRLTSHPDDRAKLVALVFEGPWDKMDAAQHLTTHKDADRFDLIAAPSSGAWKPEWGKLLGGYSGYRFLYDNDKAGREGQDRAAKLLREAQPAAKVAKLCWPAGTKEGYDVGDLIRDGKRLAGFAKEHCVPVATERRITFVLGTDIETEKQEWLWQGRLPAGATASFSGPAGTQKSTIAKDIAARLTAGLPMPGCGKETALPPCNVMYFTAEDRRSVVRDLVEAHGGDLKRLHVHDQAASDDPIDLLEHLTDLEEQVRELNARLVILDPLNAFVGGDISTDAKARRTLSGKLNALARRTGACLLLIRNWGRATDGPGSQRSLGSHSTSDVARCTMNTEELPPLDRDDPAPPRRFRLVWEKVSGAPQPDPLPYGVKDLSTGPDDSHLRHIVWGRTEAEFVAALADRTTTKRRAE